MSVRRLAADAVQPAAFAFSAENQAWAEKIIARYPAGRQQSAVIPILWRAQEQEGWVTPRRDRGRRPHAGHGLYPRARSRDVLYAVPAEAGRANAHIMVCGTTPCMLRGAGDLLDICQHKIAHDPLEVSADGKLSWEEVECPGACVNAPMIMIGNDTYEDLTAERFEEIVEAFRAGNGKSIKPGTQIDRSVLRRRGRSHDAARRADNAAHLQAVPAATAAARLLLPARHRRLHLQRPPLPPLPPARRCGSGADQCRQRQSGASRKMRLHRRARRPRRRSRRRRPMASAEGQRGGEGRWRAQPRDARERHRRGVRRPARSMAAKPSRRARPRSCSMLRRVPLTI